MVFEGFIFLRFKLSDIWISDCWSGMSAHWYCSFLPNCLERNLCLTNLVFSQGMQVSEGALFLVKDMGYMKI